jgi:NTE family protein
VRKNVQRGIDKLTRFWQVMAASEPWDQLANHALMTVTGLRELMVLPEVSPYQLPPWGEDYFRSVLMEFFDFDELRVLARLPDSPVLRIGAVEVLSGHFELFGGDELSVECLLASAAIPELFRAVTVPGRGVYWDGLFSQNPPIEDLIDRQLDELWIIQINRSTCPGVPTETHEILDRRNALSGNLSMEQELKFIERLNHGLAVGTIDRTRYRPIQVSRVSLDRELGYRSKLDRRPDFLEELREYGNTKARWFLRNREIAAGARSPLSEERAPDA